MQIVFLSNFLNHHQLHVANELYRLTNGSYRFIETEPMPNWIKKGGYSEFNDLPWLIQAWKDDSALEKAHDLFINAETAISGGTYRYIDWITERLKHNRLTFEYGERWLKRGIINLLSPRLLKHQYYYHRYFYNKPIYYLTASAFAAKDLVKLRSYKDRTFKWGYFTKVPDIDIAAVIENRRNYLDFRILSVARFLKWKHHELQVEVVARLKAKGYKFKFDMFGSGPEEASIRRMIHEKRLEDTINLCGNIPNEEILKEMREHDIFLFTSDKNEGWGAVINEAMSNGCAIVAGNKIGSVPYLIKDGINGLIFKDQNVDSLEEKIEFLINNPHKCEEYSINAYNTISKQWSPEAAALNLIELIKNIQQGIPHTIKDGPTSLTN